MTKSIETQHSETKDPVADKANPLVCVDFKGLLISANAAAAPLLTHWNIDIGGRLKRTWQSVVEKLTAEDAGLIQEMVCQETCNGTTYSLVFKRDTETGLIRIEGSELGRDIDIGLAENPETDKVSIDTLTNLPNRALFLDRLKQATYVARRNRTLMAVMVLGLDGFKAVNETYGHVAGDQLLVKVSERLREILRDSDTVARLGSDEFGIIQLNSIAHEGVTVLAQKLVEGFKKPFMLNDAKLNISASIGVSVFPHDTLECDELLRNANMALDRCKVEEAGGYRFFVARMNEEAQHLRCVISDLRNGLKNGEFEIHYQPKMDTKTHLITGMEALVRWNHPEKGFMPPGDFIPIAETTRLIIPLGHWVLREACRQTAEWNKVGISPLKVAVNLSVVQFQDERILEVVRDVLKETGLDPACLELEITEGVALEDAEQAISQFYALRELGIDVSIDDFGTGYSCLSYIKSFPIQRIKIDKAFVDDIETPGNQGAIAQAVTTMGQSFGMEITAEGVENEAQLGFLKAIGCNEIQGYFISKPLASGDFESFMADFDNTHLKSIISEAPERMGTMTRRMKDFVTKENQASHWLQSNSVQQTLTLK